MQSIRKYLKGDFALWGIFLFFVLVSFLPVYSASSNLVYVEGKGTTIQYFFRHFILMGFGIVIVFILHRFQYRYFRPISRIGLLLSWVLLFVVLLKGTTIEGANASRWLYIFGISFQPSAFAMIVLLMYVASYLADNYGQKINFRESFIALWIPVFITVGMVAIPNLSTGAIMFLMVILLVFIGKYPIKYIINIGFFGILLAVVFFLFVKAFPDAMPNRVDTWMSRIEVFINGDKQENYQSERAKMAIVSGGLFGQGAGKSVMKNLLPQSSSDFIFSIIIDEYGLIGGLVIIFFFVAMLLRFVAISTKSSTIFGKLLVIGVGLPIVLQAFINMGVAVGLLPVTGQNLPFITSGGTSIWMTCFALGIVLSVSAREDKKQSNKNEGKKQKSKEKNDKNEQKEDESEENEIESIMKEE
ncbi:MAG: FtsW/RodA/SpoVE family cell cycle protein [Capnocytophaga sp.]|nr:FtsW/RodA/SpoVE family cell cycle protein [Capnocytophaga sp.]